MNRLNESLDFLSENVHLGEGIGDVGGPAVGPIPERGKAAAPRGIVASARRTGVLGIEQAASP